MAHRQGRGGPGALPLPAVVALGAAAMPATSAATGPAAPAATPTVPPPSYPNPGTVTGDTGVQHPSVVKRPSGGYLLAHTGANLVLKTSTDRTAWHNAGAVFP